MAEGPRGSGSLIYNKKWEADLRRQVAKYFQDSHKAVSERYPYILKKSTDVAWHENVISPSVWKFIEEQIAGRLKRFALHKYAHHGLSSQAFLFNLFGPLVVEKQWHIFDELLFDAVGTVLGQVINGEFEVEDREVFRERERQPTSIDLCLSTDVGVDFFIEFKFTEKEFGGCSVFFDGGCDGRNPSAQFDLCYLHKIKKRRYWQLMENHGLLTEKIRNSFQCPFCTLYQFYRVLLFALEKNGHFLLVYDERNPSFVVTKEGTKRGLFNLVYEVLPENAKRKCHAYSVQSALGVLENHPELTWVRELKEKYFTPLR